MSNKSETKSNRSNTQISSGLSTKAMVFYFMCSFVFFFLGTYHIWNGYQSNHELSKYIVGTACLAIAIGYIFLIKKKFEKE